MSTTDVSRGFTIYLCAVSPTGPTHVITMIMVQVVKQHTTIYTIWKSENFRKLLLCENIVVNHFRSSKTKTGLKRQTNLYCSSCQTKGYTITSLVCNLNQSGLFIYKFSYMCWAEKYGDDIYTNVLGLLYSVRLPGNDLIIDVIAHTANAPCHHILLASWYKALGV